MKTTTKSRIAAIRRSIALQQRVIANLEKSIVSDGGESIALARRIITMCEGQIAALTPRDHEVTATITTAPRLALQVWPCQCGQAHPVPADFPSAPLVCPKAVAS